MHKWFIDKISEIPPTWTEWGLVITVLTSLVALATSFILIGFVSFSRKKDVKDLPKTSKAIEILVIVLVIAAIIGGIFLAFNAFGVIASIIMFIWVTSGCATLYYLFESLITEPRGSFQWKKLMIWGAIAAVTFVTAYCLHKYYGLSIK